MANFFELLGFDSNDMADAMPEKIVQVGAYCCGGGRGSSRHWCGWGHAAGVGRAS